MKWVFLFAVPVMIYAQTYFEIVENVDDVSALKSAHMLEMAAKSAAEAAKGEKLPSLDLSFGAAWLKDTPTVVFHVPGSPPTVSPMGTKRNFTGSLRLAYPLFTGFAIKASIDRAELELERVRLQRLDLKRNIYLELTRLASAYYAKSRTLSSEIKAKKAMDDAYEKAKGLYDNGLLPPADLYNIEAKRFVVEAGIAETKSQKEQILNRLGYLLGKDVDSVELPLGTLSVSIDKDALIEEALASREDIKALEKLLSINESLQNLAKSRLYPSLFLAAELKRRGDTPELNGDGFTNPDQSYIGASVTWNLFNGFSDEKRVEAARFKRLASAIELNDYKNRVKTELENAFLRLNALLSKLQSARMELKAQKAYCDLTKGRFENQLASADELSRSIADLSVAESKVSVLESQIFSQKTAIWLMAGIDSFKKRLFSIK